MNMVALDQNTLYIIIAILVVVIILFVVIMRRRGSKEGPSNINQYLAKEAQLKKVQIVESEEGFRTKIPLYMRRPQDDLNDIRETTSELFHKNAYYNSKVEDEVESLEAQDKQVNLQKQVKGIEKKNLELNRRVKPKKGSKSN